MARKTSGIRSDKKCVKETRQKNGKNQLKQKKKTTWELNGNYWNKIISNNLNGGEL